ncbi:MAG TPA: hypothetical protein VNL91_02735, partial [Thermoanaerobaculia bacterium]|nr:hypothetical protein [Thermoanaerobaculia bacterium]
HLAALANLSFAGRYPASLFPPMPALLVAVALVLLVVAVSRSARFSAAVLLPIALAIAFGLAGRAVYFPMRFESVVAVPLALWGGHALGRWTPAVRGAVAAALMGIGVASILVGVIDHLRRPLDPYREAALLVRRAAPPDATVVASGYCYLETLMNARRRVVPFAPGQGRHPGWREHVTAEEAMHLAESNLPPGEFFFVGEAMAPEWHAVRRRRPTQVLIANPHVVVARVRAKATLH